MDQNSLELGTKSDVVADNFTSNVENDVGVSKSSVI